MNPPYGERLYEKEETNTLYESIGDTLKQKYKGYRAWIISSNRQALNHIGLHAERKIVIFNGQLECRFMRFDIYEGTKRKFNTQTNDTK
jgi:putative N6-adenine-specific DNA methylase